ncbi:MAG TPA: hypothetical protein VFC18_21670 [Burkholderiales bacterium]|nr:hypothetical protein [Burkholderiales bacterium]
MTDEAPSSTCAECGGRLPKSKRNPRVTCSTACRRARDVRRERERFEQAKAEAGGRPRKTCKRCGVEKQLHPGYWVHSRGVPIGDVCILCDRARTRDEYTPRVRAKKAERNRLPKEVQKKVQQARKQAEQAARKAQTGGDRDAFRAGAAALNAIAPATLAELLVHLQNPASPLHHDALRLFAERAMPQSFYDDVAKQTVRAGDDGGSEEVPHLIQVSQCAGPDSQTLED